MINSYKILNYNKYLNTALVRIFLKYLELILCDWTPSTNFETHNFYY
jgi:hypothetical protein